MATKTVEVTPSAYVKLDTGAATVIDFQNISATPVRVVMASSLPSPNATNYYFVQGLQGVSRDGKADDFYVRSDQAARAFITVGE